MNISGIRPSASFYSYNSIKINELRNQQIAAAKEAASVKEPEVEEENIVASPAPQQNFTSYDFAQQYNPDESYELKGVDSDVRKLDVQKAVSELDKDQVLRQYQYFVGDKMKTYGTTGLWWMGLYDRKTGEWYDDEVVSALFSVHK